MPDHAFCGSGCSLHLFSLECSPHERSTMAKKKIDPLNKKAYGAVSAALTVADIPAAVSFYQKAFGFAKRAIMNGPDAKPGKPRYGKTHRQERRRVPGELVSLRRKGGQSSGESGQAGSYPSGSG